VCALLLHAPYLFPHTRLPTGIIACTHGSPAPVLAVTPRFFDWRNGTRIPLRLVPNREGAAPLGFEHQIGLMYSSVS
jgi:hypothetical protein